MPEETPPDTLVHLLGSKQFSGIVSFIHRGRERMTFASGLANRKTGEPNRLSTRFPIASVGKIFTAICVARLVDQGICGFDRSLVEIVPWMEPHCDTAVSLASLLSHTSGLGDYIDDEAELPFANLDVERLDSVRAFLPYVLSVPRGTAGEFRYSSAGFILLGLAIEAMTGISYHQAIDRFVTGPAGMSSTGFPKMNDASPNLAVGYLDSGLPNFGHLPKVGGPDGGIVTTADDLRRLFECLRGHQLLTEASKDFLWREKSRANSLSGYGHGFYVTKVCGSSWYGHTGSDPGISARVAFSPESDSSIVILCNQGDVAFPVFRAVLDWIGNV